MGSTHSQTFNHPDLLVTFTCNPAFNCLSHKWYRCNSSGCCIGNGYGCFGFSCIHTTDPGWQRNSPLRIELVDLLTDALKAMGGWPSLSSGSCFAPPFSVHVPPQLVLAFNKVCKKFNDDKLFDMGLQCRAITFRKDITGDKNLTGYDFAAQLLVLVEKKSEYKLRDVGETLEHLTWLEGNQGGRNEHEIKSLLAWSPPEDWMTRLTPPYNEATNHV